MSELVFVFHNISPCVGFVINICAFASPERKTNREHPGHGVCDGVEVMIDVKSISKAC